MERGMTDIESIAACKLLEVLGQLLALWKLGAVEQYRDYGNVALQRGRDFNAHEIICVIQATVPLLVTDIKPIGSDDCKQRVTSSDFLAQDLDEVRAQRNGVNIHEQKIAPKLLRHSIMNAPGMTRAVVAAIADKKLAG